MSTTGQLKKPQRSSPLCDITSLMIPNYTSVAMGGSENRDPVTPPPSSPLTEQLSIQTLLPSDFSSRTCSTIVCTKEGDYITPSPPALPLPNTWTVGRATKLRYLGKHMDFKMPDVVEASKIYQKAVGLRNTDEYVAPPQPDVSGVDKLVTSNPGLWHLREDMGLLSPIGHGQMNQAGFGAPKTGWDNVEISGPETASAMRYGRDKSGGHPNLEQRRIGLRESLLWHGRQPYGRLAKVELASLSFHDLTPSMRSGNFSNELLSHFSADSAGKTRILGYEMDVLEPQPYHNMENPPITERWIAFMISTPIVTVNPAYCSSFGPEPLPPNLPRPTPTSWVMFAAPLARVACYPPQRHTIVASTKTMDPTNNYNSESQLCDVMRLDYDFSLDGVPVFEFMDKTKLLGELGTEIQKGIQGEFLCAVRDLVGWKEANGGVEDGNDVADLPLRRSYANFTTPNSKKTKVEMDVDNEIAPNKPHPGIRDEIKSRSISPDAKMDGKDIGEDVSEAEVGRQGAVWKAFDIDASQWWTHARVNFWRDSCRWERIKEVMARGCCRVVVTIADSPGPARGSGFGSGPPSGPDLGPSAGPSPSFDRERVGRQRFAFSEGKINHPKQERWSRWGLDELIIPGNQEGPTVPTMMTDAFESDEDSDQSDLSVITVMMLDGSEKREDPIYGACDSDRNANMLLD